MTCQDIRDLFSARADDALAAGERARLDAHLATCADCAREWRRFEATVGLLRAVEPARAPIGFVDRVLAARPKPWYRRLARGLLVPWPVKLPLQAAAVVLIAGLAILIFQRSPDLQQAARAPETLESPRAPSSARDADAPAVSAPAAPAPSAPVPAVSAPPPAAVPEASAPARQETPAPGLAAGERSVDAVAPEKETRAKSATSERPARLRDSRANEADVPAEQPRAERPPAASATPPGSSGIASSAAPEPKRELSAESLAKESQRLARRRDQRVAALAHVEARLATPDRAAAEREIRAVVARLGGVVTSAPESLEIVVPGSTWDELTRELGRLGTLRIERRQAELPSAVRVTIRLE